MTVKVTDPITKEVLEYYIDPRLKKSLDNKLIPILQKKDEDFVLIIDGAERGGKSTLAMQIGKYVDPSLNLDRICFTADEFRKAIVNATKGQCVIYDEAYRGLSAKGALTEINRILVSMMMEMGQKNLFVIIILPTFYLLEKYVAVWRARGLLHVYRSRGKKGYWIYFNQRKKKLLYLRGKKDYSYRYVRSDFKGRFYGKMVLNDEEYRRKKATTFRSGFKTTRQERFKEQRDNLLRLLYPKYIPSLRELSKTCLEFNVRLNKDKIAEIVNENKK